MTLPLSLDIDQAIASGLVTVSDSSRVYPRIRIIPYEDDGTSAGMIHIGSQSIIRDGCIICSGVVIGDGTILGHNTVVRQKVRIGQSCVLSHAICLERGVTIGDNCRISALTHLTGGCVIENDVQIGARVVTINDNELQWRKEPTLKAPTFRTRSRVGSGSTILGGVEIGEGTIIGAGSVVTRSMPPNVLAYGVPAYVQGDVIT